MIRASVVSLVLLGGFGAALAQETPTQTCQDDLQQDRQPNFAEGGFSSLGAVAITDNTPPQLQLNTNLSKLDPEKIVLPFDQELSVSYVYESAGASHTLGWFYLDDLIKAGYVSADGKSLLDNDGDGIDDFHEDMFNMSNTRPWVGKAGDRRCSSTFKDDGTKYRIPDLATPSNCDGNYRTGQSLSDATDASAGNWDVNLIGNTPGGNSSDSDFGDQGLFPHVPNLLEPASAENGYKGIGHLIFLLNDDDGDNDYWKHLPPVADDSTATDGIPDYDVSAYDASGRPLGKGNPNKGISGYDRTVSLGTVKGNKEVVFYTVVYYASGQGGGTVYPCLKFKDYTVNVGTRSKPKWVTKTKCELHLVTPINVFFSKSILNMDTNPDTSDPIAMRDIGQKYSESCDRSNPSTDAAWATLYDPGYADDGQSKKLCGWLDQGTLNRLDTATYRNLVLDHQGNVVHRPADGKMVHTILGAPKTDLNRWILGFEDLPGGGDRDFNDVVFTINKLNGGSAVSGVVSGDISPAIANDFTITQVVFSKDDVPFTIQGSHAGACNGPPPAAINYYVAVDCRICAAGVCTSNDSPSWVPVTFPSGSNTATLNMLDLGFTGSQLCWKATLTSPSEYCTPTINNVDVKYQAIRAGAYGRSSPTPVANAVGFGTFEVGGSTWNGVTAPLPTKRIYDGKLDFSPRGHLKFESLYDPEDPSTTNPVLRWDAGRVMADAIANGQDPESFRKLYTLAQDGTRMELKDELADGNDDSAAFPATFCAIQGSAGKPLYDLNQLHNCDNDPNHGPTDRSFLRHWLYGWEQKDNPTAGTLVARPWPLGGDNLSTPAIIGPPTLPTWFYKAAAREQSGFTENFQKTLKDRPTYAYVGTTTGMLEAFDAGQLANGDDPCTEGADYHGYFKAKNGTCTKPKATRDYGTGEEAFAYLPRQLLPRYANNYVRYGNGTVATPTTVASLDASPSVADIDLRGLDTTSPPWTISTDPTKGAKTVLVSPTGKYQSTVFSLDITKVGMSDAYPIPMWEFDMADPDIQSDFSTEAVKPDSTVLLPDGSGSRHSPPITQMQFKALDGTNYKNEWVAVIGTDFHPSQNHAGSVYLVGMGTGHPVEITKTGATHTWDGVIPLATDEGIAGEPVVLDTDGDGVSDVVYAAGTDGRIWRINPTRIDPSAPLGQKIPACEVANIPADLKEQFNLSDDDAALQGVHSSIAVKLVQQGNGPVVRFYVGTSDDPDDANDAQASYYYLVAYEDAHPIDETCSASYVWGQQLDEGQRVWGGVVSSADEVYTTTAVGRAADACNLSNDTSGQFLAINASDGTVDSKVALGAQGTSAPVIHDNHLFMVNAVGGASVKGKPGWNNPPAQSGNQRARVLLWQNSGGTLPK